MQLYVERGFAQTTVAEIADRAGVTPRTFFRYFADKREVLFGGSTLLQEAMVEAVHNTPSTAPPMVAVAAALDRAADFLGGRHDFSRQRQALIKANPELQERELIKLATLASALTDSLRLRGVPDPEAGLAAETGMAVFRVAFDTWATGPGDRVLAQVMSDAMGRLSSITQDR
ncbi:MAG: regulatory protein TetR [Marmoricola sp.]|nr:regulatory protein TetR [Marmoricola sp.]